MQFSYIFVATIALFATASFADYASGSNENIGDTSGLINNPLADGLLNDNSQDQATGLYDI